MGKISMVVNISILVDNLWDLVDIFLRLVDKTSDLVDIFARLVVKINALVDIPFLVDKICYLVDKIHGLVDIFPRLVDKIDTLVDKNPILVSIPGLVSELTPQQPFLSSEYILKFLLLAKSLNFCKNSEAVKLFFNPTFFCGTSCFTWAYTTMSKRKEV